jgi:hypothetical protein
MGSDVPSQITNKPISQNIQIFVKSEILKEEFGKKKVNLSLCVTN